MSEICKRPWKITKNRSGEICILDADRYWITNFTGEDEAEYIVKCVNEHDALIAEVERLNKELVSEVILDRCIFNALERRAEKAEAEVEELKEVIREAMRRLKPNEEKDGAKDGTS